MMQDVNELYRRFRHCPPTLDGRNLRVLADFIVDERGVSLEDDTIVFTGAEAGSPFREIKLEHVHGVADVGDRIAIVLHSSIIFLHKETLQTSVHLRKLSLWERCRGLLRL